MDEVHINKSNIDDNVPDVGNLDDDVAHSVHEVAQMKPTSL